MNGVLQAAPLAFGREFPFTQADFRFVQQLVKERTGINLSDSKDDLVYARLAKRLRTLGLASFAAYCRYVAQHDDERINLINAITTNLTAFFRERHHFDYLREVAIPALAHEKRDSRRLRIWSAGCSSGEEPYSIAMTVLEALPQPERWDLRILATDLDSNMVAKAEAGIYGAERVQGLSSAQRNRWFLCGDGANQGRVRIRPELKEVLRFRQLNLMDPWPMAQPFDIIFCRNVVIYFDKATQCRLFNRYAEQLHPQGALIIGHSESLHNVAGRFKPAGKTIYRKVC